MCVYVFVVCIYLCVCDFQPYKSNLTPDTIMKLESKHSKIISCQNYEGWFISKESNPKKEHLFT